MVKNKMRGRLFIWIVLLTFLLGVNSERVFAAETNQRGVIVETTFDKSSYQSGENVIYSVYIQNTNSEGVDIKDINLDIPDGYKLSEETTSESVQIIQPGEHILFKYYLDEKNTNSGSDNDGSNTKGDAPSGGDKKDNDSKGDSDTKIDKPSNGNYKDDSVKNNKESTNKSEAKQIGTGDHAKTLLWIVMMVVALTIILIIASHMKNKKGLLSLLLIMATLTEIIISPISVKAKDNPNTITLSDKFVANNDEKIINIQINFEKQSVDLDEDTATYTRGEWIQKIIETYGIEGDINNTIESQFKDITDSTYYRAIRIAEIYGIVDKTEFFCPDENVTREFAAVTTVRLMGYQGEGEPSCKDFSDITYRNEVYLALKAGIMLLKNGEFAPQKLLTKTDGEYILQYIQNINQEINKNEEKNEYIFKNNVINLGDSIEYADDGENLILDVNLNDYDFEENKVIIVNNIPYKIKGLEENNGKVRIQYTTPEMDEYLKSMDVRGEIREIDWSKFELAEGVSIAEENAIETFSNDAEAKEADGEIVDIASKSISLKAGNYLTIDLTASDFKLKYGFDIDGESHRIRKAYAIVNGNIISSLDLEESLEGENPIDQDDEIKLGELHTNPMVSVKLSLVFEVNGGVSLKATLNQTGGVQIINNMSRIVNDFSVSDFYAKISVSGSIGIKTSVSLKALTKEMLSVYYTPKIVVSVAETTHSTRPICCYSLSGYLTVDIGADGLVLDWLKLSIKKSLYDIDNSIFQINDFIHLEKESAESSVKVVSKCSYLTKHLLNIKVIDAATAKVVENAKIIINGSPIYDCTDENGVVNKIGVEGNMVNIIVEKDGYFQSEMEKDISDYNEQEVIEIALTPITENINSIQGHIYELDSEGNLQSNNPITNAKIELTLNQIGTSTETYQSDEQGYYNISNIMAGTYTLKITKEGYVDYVEDNFVIENSLTDVNFGMSSIETQGVCRIGNVTFDTLEEAVMNSKAGDTINLYGDDISQNGITINHDLTITATKNVHTSFNAYRAFQYMTNNATLTLNALEGCTWDMSVPAYGELIVNNNVLNIGDGLLFHSNNRLSSMAIVNYKQVNINTVNRTFYYLSHGVVNYDGGKCLYNDSKVSDIFDNVMCPVYDM